MRITLKNEYYTVTIKDKRAEHDVHEMMQLFKQGALALGYQPETVQRGFKGMVEEACADSQEEYISDNQETK